MDSNSQGKYRSSIEMDLYYFDKLPKKIREYVSLYPEKIASFPILEAFRVLKVHYYPNEDKAINVVLDKLERKKRELEKNK